MNESKQNNCHCGDYRNPAIECTVKDCSYHCKTENYCSLEHIKVSAHEASPKSSCSVDCQSFRPCQNS